MSPYDKSQPTTIQKMFGAIAPNYDRTNSILSFQLHKYWNSCLVKSLPKGNTLLDLCSGTGEIAFRAIPIQPNLKKAILADFCQEMLQCAKQKGAAFKNISLEYIQADVEQLPFPDQSADLATVAYGIRNVKNPRNCFVEVYRVLQPGGTFAILELTQPKNPLLRFGHRLYLRQVLPFLGKCFTSNREAYQYLCNSIQAFVEPEALIKMLVQAGFVEIEKRSLTFGAATLLVAKKSKSTS